MKYYSVYIVWVGDSRVWLGSGSERWLLATHFLLLWVSPPPPPHKYAPQLNKVAMLLLTQLEPTRPTNNEFNWRTDLCACVRGSFGTSRWQNVENLKEMQAVKSMRLYYTRWLFYIYIYILTYLVLKHFIFYTYCSYVIYLVCAKFCSKFCSPHDIVYKICISKYPCNVILAYVQTFQALSMFILYKMVVEFAGDCPCQKYRFPVKVDVCHFYCTNQSYYSKTQSLEVYCDSV